MAELAARRRRCTITSDAADQRRRPAGRASGSHSTSWDCAEVSTIGFCLVSLARIEMQILLLGEPGHDVEEEVRDCPGRPRNWLEAKSAVPTTTMRAFGGLLRLASPSGLRRRAWPRVDRGHRRPPRAARSSRSDPGWPRRVWRTRSCPSRPTTARWSAPAAGRLHALRRRLGRLHRAGQREQRHDPAEVLGDRVRIVLARRPARAGPRRRAGRSGSARSPRRRPGRCRTSSRYFTEALGLERRRP